MSCIDAACYRRKYAIVFLLMRHGVTSKTIRERHQYFIDNYPKDNIRLIDDKVEQIMNYMDNLPVYENFVLVRNMQKKTNGAVTKQPELAKYPTLLKGLISRHFEDILKNYVKVNETETLDSKAEPEPELTNTQDNERRRNDY